MKSLSLILLIFINSIAFSQIDVAITEIISPPDTILSHSNHSPKLILQNYSNNLATGAVYYHIDSLGTIISSEQKFLSLNPLDTDTVEFSNWKSLAVCNQSLNILFLAFFAGDSNSTNDFLTKEITVLSEVVFEDVTDQAIPNLQIIGGVRSSAWADLNDDGFLDIFFKDGADQIYLNDGNGIFSFDMATSWGIINPPGVSGSSIIVDFDNDDDLDILSGQYLYKNVGNSTNPSFFNFLDLGFFSNASVFDMNKDSFLDIYTGVVGGSPDYLYQNDGVVLPANVFSFTENGVSLNISYSSNDPREPWHMHSHSVTCVDYNQDGWTDIYVGHDSHSGQFNRMLKNNKLDSLGNQNPFSLMSGPNVPSIFPPQADSIGAGFNNTYHSAFGDFNNDGLIDIFISSTIIFNNQLYNILYEHSLTSPYQGVQDYFTDVAQIKGVAGNQPTTTNESSWADFDNDGWLDLLVGNEYYNSELYHNRGNNYSSEGFQTQFTLNVPFSNLEIPLDRVRSVNSVDFDNDGLMDIFLGIADTTSGSKLLRNVSCNENNWIQLDLVGTQSNRSAIGSQVKLYSGGMLQYRQIIGGSGHSMESLRVEFGLGQNTYIDSLVIDWQSGTHQVFYDGQLNVNSINEVVEDNFFATLAVFPMELSFLNGELGTVDSTWIKLQNNWTNYFVAISKIEGKFPYNSVLWANENSILIPPQSEDSVLVYYLHNFQQLNTELEIIFNSSAVIEIPVFGELVTSIDYENSQLPTEFSLTQNYPNPFNPTTRIEFGIPQESNVQLQIFNIKGRLVKELVNSKLNAGFYNFDWNGTDKNGSKVSSGVYFYKLQTDEFSQTKKMILIK